MARKMQRRASSASLLALTTLSLVAFTTKWCSAQLTANRHTLRYDGEVNIGEAAVQIDRELENRSIGEQISLGLSPVPRPSNSADCWETDAADIADRSGLG